MEVKDASASSDSLALVLNRVELASQDVLDTHGS